MKKHILIKSALVLSLCAVLAVLTSCKDKIMGYSVLLWNLPEQEMQDGDTVPVYIRSNITQVYVVENHKGEKIEIPLWMLTEPVKKNKLDSQKKIYADCAHKYASVKIDGLPCRAEAVNTAKQVYRLRKGEVIKILYKGKGQAPMTGGKPLEGDWYRILASDGTKGWCFSYNLNIYETDITGGKVGGEVDIIEDTTDKYFDAMVNRIWYPDSYKTMISTGNIDPEKLSTSNFFVLDPEAEKVTLNMNGIHETWNYEGYTKTGDKQYQLKNIPIILIYKKAGFIVARYTNESGKPQEINLVLIDVNINEVVQKESQRRAQTYAKVVSLGNKFVSSNYGTLDMDSDGNFKWTNFKLLVPSVISKNAKTTGKAYVKYALGKNVSASYDGVLTFMFDGTDTEVNFLYKIDNGRLRLEDAVNATYNGNLVTAKSGSPIIISFNIQ
ncbi:MAG: SH3 domain-containing protein [Treponema sp.]|nr:SH3 domain-containing protein [Treponema sp.]